MVLNLTNMFSMRVEPPPLGIGRVHTTATDLTKPSEEYRESMDRRVIANEAKLMAVLSEEPKTLEQIFTAAMMSRTTARRLLGGLVAKGSAVRLLDGKRYLWQLAEDVERGEGE